MRQTSKEENGSYLRKEKKIANIMLCIVKANETKNKRTKKDLKRTKKDLEKKRKREREMLKQSSKYTKTKVLKFSKPSTNTRKNGMKD